MRGDPFLCFHDVVLVSIQLVNQFDVKILETVCLLKVTDCLLTLLDQWSERAVCHVVGCKYQYTMRIIPLLFDVLETSLNHEICLSHSRGSTVKDSLSLELLFLEESLIVIIFLINYHSVTFRKHMEKAFQSISSLPQSSIAGLL